MNRTLASCAILASITLSACVDGGGLAGLGTVPLASEGGPTVVFDPLRLPDPEIPLPNDFALRVDPTSPTGVRLNLTTQAGTATETALRRQIDRLDGFSLLGPVTVAFDGPLDLTTVRGDTVWLVDVEPGSEAYGQVVPLDLGEGSYPSASPRHNYFPNDPRRESIGFVFPDDNLADADGDGTPEYVSFWEVASNTLLIRPLLPLRERTRYAVVLTRGLAGWTDADGTHRRGPVRSPFDGVNHPSQNAAVREAVDSLGSHGVTEADVAFAWTFRTQSVTDVYTTVRAGLYGEGPMAWLKDQVSDKLVSLHDTGISFDGTGEKAGFPRVDRDSIFILQAAFMAQLFNLVGPFIDAGFGVDVSAVDYYVFGEIEAPYFLTEATDRVFDLDTVTGRATMQIQRVPFMLSIPKATERFKPPFPVVFYSHGSYTSRFESLLLSGSVARSGLATAAIDSVGHGPIGADVRNLMKDAGISEEMGKVIFMALAKVLFVDNGKSLAGKPFDEMLDALLGVGIIQELTEVGRARDENGDGIIKNGEAFYVANPIRLRDNFRQSNLDFLQFVRVIRALDPAAVPAGMKGDDTFTAGAEQLAPHLFNGDFNADGVLDLGGPDVPFYMGGTSLGALMASAMASVEPEIRAATLLVPGGGVADIFVSTTMNDAATPAFLYSFGPVLAGCLGDGLFRVVFNDDAGNCKAERLATPGVAVATFPAVGSTGVSVRNQRSGEEVVGWLNADLGFSVAVAADKGDPLELTVTYADRDPVTVVVPARHAGLGIQRNTPKFRRNLQLFQTIFDPIDPGVLGQFLIRRPLDGRPKNVLQFVVLGDDTVPVASQLTLARVMGLLGLDDVAAVALNSKLVAGGVPTGAGFDVDDLEHDDDDELGPLPTLHTEQGLSAVRFMNVNGWHEYMALPYPEDEPFDYSTWTHNVLRLYLESGGTRLRDDPCLESWSCDPATAHEAP